MNRQKRFAEILCVVAFLGTAAVLVNSSHSARNPQPARTTAVKTRIFNPASPDEFQKIVDAANEERRKSAQASVDARRLEMSRWHGSMTVPGPQVKEADKPRFQAICDLFANEPPAPDARKAQFAWCLDPQSEYRCVGYLCWVVSVSDTDQGSEIVLHVYPRLLGAYAPLVECGQKCIETWHVSKGGQLTFVSAVPLDPNQPSGLNTLHNL